MREILQGTTPSLELKIKKEDFNVLDVIKLELVMRHNGVMTIYGLGDVSVDTETNSFTYKFTEEETLAMVPKKSITYQLRFMFADGSIVGTKPMVLEVADLLSEDVMTE